jgi:aryl-alcohol dehydrogenase-like predicted oxidoreductase
VRRALGRGGIEVSALGMGTWAIGGAMDGPTGRPLGWGEVDDAVSVRAIQTAMDLGVTLFDTADVYGIGHAETILGAALGPARDTVVIATKWGIGYDERRGHLLPGDGSPEYARVALAASLRRLGTDYVDVYQLHLNDLPAGQAEELVGVCEALVDEGLIRGYGWSTDDVAEAAVFAKGPHCWVVQHELNVFSDAAALEMVALCEAHDLASLNRSPLAMGLLTDKVTADSRFAPDTVRGAAPAWLAWFAGGRPVPAFLERRDAVRDVLTSGGRTLAQGALAWVWARSDRTIPLPGCRTPAQAAENAAAMAHGPLRPDQMAQIEQIMSGHP